MPRPKGSQNKITPKKETQDGRKKTLPNKARRKRIRRAEYVTDGKEGNQYRKRYLLWYQKGCSVG